MTPHRKRRYALGPNLAAFYADTAPGWCAGCGRPLKGYLPSARVCRHPDCARLYHRAYGYDRRARLGMTPRGGGK